MYDSLLSVVNEDKRMDRERRSGVSQTALFDSKSSFTINSPSKSSILLTR